MRVSLHLGVRARGCRVDHQRRQRQPSGKDGSPVSGRPVTSCAIGHCDAPVYLTTVGGLSICQRPVGWDGPAIHPAGREADHHELAPRAAGQGPLIACHIRRQHRSSRARRKVVPAASTSTSQSDSPDRPPSWLPDLGSCARTAETIGHTAASTWEREPSPSNACKVAASNLPEAGVSAWPRGIAVWNELDHLARRRLGTRIRGGAELERRGGRRPPSDIIRVSRETWSGAS
jgi:hypothetical protein